MGGSQCIRSCVSGYGIAEHRDSFQPIFLDLKTLLIRIILGISKKGTAAVFGSFYSLEKYLTVNDEEVVKLPVQ